MTTNFWHPLLRSLAALAFPVILTQCAGRAGPATGVEPLLAYELQPDSCAPSPVPSQLPSVGDLVDTAALTQHLGQATTQRPPVTFTMEFGSDGSLRRLGLLNEVGDARAIELLRSALASSVRPQPAAAPWTIRLRIPVDSDTTTRVERSEFCPPMPMDSPGPQLGYAVAPMTLPELEELRRAGPFRIRLRIDAAGVVRQADLVQSSGSSFQDRFALDRARERRFRPALLDGVPVPGWYEIRSRR